MEPFFIIKTSQLTFRLIIFFSDNNSEQIPLEIKQIGDLALSFNIAGEEQIVIADGQAHHVKPGSYDKIHTTCSEEGLEIENFAGGRVRGAILFIPTPTGVRFVKFRNGNVIFDLNCYSKNASYQIIKKGSICGAFPIIVLI